MNQSELEQHVNERTNVILFTRETLNRNFQNTRHFQSKGFKCHQREREREPCTCNVCTEVFPKTSINHHSTDQRSPQLSQTKHRPQLSDSIIFTQGKHIHCAKMTSSFLGESSSYVWPTPISLLAFNENIPDHFQRTIKAVYTRQVHARGFSW